MSLSPRFREAFLNDCRFTKYFLFFGFVILSLSFQTSPLIWSRWERTVLSVTLVEFGVIAYCLVVYRCLIFLHYCNNLVLQSLQEGALMKLVGRFRQRVIEEAKMNFGIAVVLYVFMSALWWVLHHFRGGAALSLRSVVYAQLFLLFVCAFALAYACAREWSSARKDQRMHEKTESQEAARETQA